MNTDKPKGEYTEGNCSKCGVHGISSVREIDDTDFITISGNGVCRQCNFIASEERTARLNPRYARRIAKSVKAKYTCPGLHCGYDFNTKADLATHIAGRHSTFELEQLLGLRR